MFSIRNVGGVSLFLFGTTFLWLTPVYAANDIDTSGAVWAMTGVLATVALIGFTVAAWGLFRRTGWWELVASVSAIAGLATLVPYWFAADSSGVTNPAFDVVIHALGSIGVLILLRVPKLEHWVHGHVAAGR
jgi:peptidoglycan/LPS O-acetylase OafA/YrhL